MSCAAKRHTVFTVEEVKAIVEEVVAGRYHPEFGTEWQEGGSLSEIIRAAQEEAWQRAHDNYCERCWSSRPCPNPYRKES